KAEAQDASGRNNANFATPPDGQPGRMQMYTWNGLRTTHMTVNTPATIAGPYSAGTASFGPQSFNVTGDVVLANDGGSTAPDGTPTDGCEAITNNVAGKIALIDRGLCNFVVKVAKAQAAGAIGVLIADNRVAAIPPGMGGTDPSITIP